jgi:hypothetical protein
MYFTVSSSLSVLSLPFFFLFSLFWTIYGLIDTEIDWAAYMQQIHTFLHDHQLDYAKLQGQTGPLV